MGYDEFVPCAGICAYRSEYRRMRAPHYGHTRQEWAALTEEQNSGVKGKCPQILKAKDEMRHDELMERQAAHNRARLTVEPRECIDVAMETRQ